MKTFHYLDQIWTILRQDKFKVEAVDQAGDRYILNKHRIKEFLK